MRQSVRPCWRRTSVSGRLLAMPRLGMSLHERNLCVSEHLGSLGRRELVVGRLLEQVDDEGCGGDLGADVGELREEAEDGVLALPERARVGDAGSLLLVLEVVLGDLGQLGECEKDGDGGTEAGDCVRRVNECQ